MIRTATSTTLEVVTKTTMKCPYSSCMGDRSFDRTSTAVDDNGPTGNDNVDDKQINGTEKMKQ